MRVNNRRGWNGRGGEERRRGAECQEEESRGEKRIGEERREKEGKGEDSRGDGYRVNERRGTGEGE